MVVHASILTVYKSYILMQTIRTIEYIKLGKIESDISSSDNLAAAITITVLASSELYLFVTYRNSIS